MLRLQPAIASNARQPKNYTTLRDDLRFQTVYRRTNWLKTDVVIGALRLMKNKNDSKLPL